MPNDIQDRISQAVNTAIETKITPATTLVHNRLDTLLATQASATGTISRNLDANDKSTKEALRGKVLEDRDAMASLESRVEQILISQGTSAEVTTNLRANLKDLCVSQSTSNDAILRHVKQSSHYMAKAAHTQFSDARAQSSRLHRKLDQVDASIGTIRDSLRSLSSAKINSSDPEISRSEAERAVRNILCSIWLLLSSLQLLIREVV